MSMNQMSDLLLDFIPSELILSISNYTEPEEFFHLISLFPQLTDKSLPLARKIVGYRTGLQTNSFDLWKLKQLSKFHCARNIFCGFSAFITSHNGCFRIIHEFEYGCLKSNIYDYFLKPLNLNNIDQISNFRYREGLLTLYVANNNLYSYKKRNNYEAEINLKLENVHSVSVNTYHGLILKHDGTVYGIGSGSSSLASVDYRYCDEPIRITQLNDIIQVSAGHDHSLALTLTGKVYEFGNSELYANDEVFPHIPYLLSIDNAVQIAAGYIYSLVLDSRGNVYLFESNKSQYIGHGFYSDMPVLIKSNIVSIAAKGRTSLLLDDNGQVYAFMNEKRQKLGDKTKILPPILIKELINIIQIAVGESYSLLIDNNGNIYLFGTYTNNKCYDKPTLLYQMPK
jgi:hypothetical protein